MKKEEGKPKKLIKCRNNRKCWSEMNTELLTVIFTRIQPLDAMLRSIPFVCKSWKEVVGGPDCWVHIDLEPWCRRVADVDAVDSAVGKLVRRSSGTIKSLYAYKIGNSGFYYACNSGSFLRALKMPMSVVTDQMLEKHINSLSLLTMLDISYCLLMTSKSIEIIGNQCKSLMEFRRNMPPPPENDDAKDESEALAIANTMHGIKHLELAYGRFSNHGLGAILSNCTLCVLDIRGCWNVELEGETESKTDLVRDFWAPWENNDVVSGEEGDDSDEDDSEDAFVDVDTSDDDEDDDGYD